METKELMQLINDSFDNREGYTFSENLVPGEIFMAVVDDNRIPALVLLGRSSAPEEYYSLQDLFTLINSWIMGEDPFNLDWDTDDCGWVFAITLDLYHSARSPQRWLRNTINLDPDLDIIYPDWVLDAGSQETQNDNYIWGIAIRLEDYYS